MPTSRSAKEVCREFGPESISCRVATKREKRRKEFGTETEAPRPEPAAEGETPAPPEERDTTRRRRYLDEKIEEAGG